MSKSDNKFVNTSQEYELQDWLYRNDFSRKQSNVDELSDIIADTVKGGNTLKNITWDELDDALKNQPKWFSSFAEVGA